VCIIGSYVSGYNNRFKKRLQKSHPNIWEFIKSLKDEVQIVHDSITQINSGMAPQEKKLQSKLVIKRVQELYDRFKNGKITIETLLKEHLFYVSH